MKMQYSYPLLLNGKMKNANDLIYNPLDKLSSIIFAGKPLAAYKPWKTCETAGNGNCYFRWYLKRLPGVKDTINNYERNFVVIYGCRKSSQAERIFSYAQRKSSTSYPTVRDDD